MGGQFFFKFGRAPPTTTPGSATTYFHPDLRHHDLKSYKVEVHVQTSKYMFGRDLDS